MTREFVKIDDYDEWTLFHKNIDFSFEGEAQYGVFGSVLGNSVLIGADTNDLIYGVFGNDYLNGGNGNDRLMAGWGNDVLFGGSGDDLMYGDEGNDYLNGGLGKDVLVGGNGQDVFAFNLLHMVGDQVFLNDAVDIVKDFNVDQDSIRFVAGETDNVTRMTAIDTDWFNENVSMSVTDGNTTVAVYGQEVATFIGVDLTQVQNPQDMFLF